METRIQIRFGELSTKGKNKKRFVQQLTRNIRQATFAFPQIEVKPTHDFIFLNLNGEDEAAVIERLKDIFGIANFSPVYVLPRDYERAQTFIVEALGKKAKAGTTFKVDTRRSDHTYEHDTAWINSKLGAAILDAYPDLRVKMKNPEIRIRFDVKEDYFLVSTETYSGAGGLPVGSNGRGMLMLSGGIDSPVAGYLAMKRGVQIEVLHFHSPPYTSPQALKKAQDLTTKLTRFGGEISFIEVPFTEIQEEIKAKIPDEYAMTITRRMMLRITDKVRAKKKHTVIFNGESLGQVASQTLDSMAVINEVTCTPIIRPLATMDKNEIIALAKRIDTFDLSIQPFEDCCTIFAPRAPKTRPHFDKIHRFEQLLDISGLVERSVDGMTVTKMNEQLSSSEKGRDYSALL